MGLLLALAMGVGTPVHAGGSQDDASSKADRRDVAAAHGKPRVVRSTYADLEVFPIESGLDGRLVLRLTIRPHPALHVYAADQSGLLGPMVTFPAGSGIETLKVERPDPEVIEAGSASAGTLVYRGPFTLRYDVRARRANRGRDPDRIMGTLRYQACTDRVCFKPETTRLEWVRGRHGEPKQER